ncbi:MAG: DUF302 domain-containing protein [Thermomicrobiales bacterium]|nr:DUF302 domain-containing protein [Thermomicrobiales bacterium]
MIEHGLVTVLSRRSVADTIDALAATVEAAGLTVFARIDHAAGAVSAGLSLRPTELLVFGNPRAGTPLMQENQVAGLDLPMKALAWEDENGEVWITYPDAAWIGARHGLGPECAAAIAAIRSGTSHAVVQAAGT